MIRRLAFVGCLLALLLTVCASAARASDPEFDQYAAMAQQWWGNGALPPCGEMSATMVEPAEIAMFTGMPLGIAMAAANAQTCQMIFSRPAWLEMSHNWRCRSVVHEEGHEYGFGHIEGTIMAARLYLGPFALCDDYTRTYYPKRRSLVYRPRLTRAGGR